ncbi:alkaline phosphatase family protein [Methylobrevis albus]|uniref:Sulfatase n=1 Tax=Methylobrevis albus TaxID=2793297 RepID=A0A931MZM2_9HYPH|nr:sulfatase [Methylobrevis albus]MBH0237896.1 sulfatase [Methylobrevis albus]
MTAGAPAAARRRVGWLGPMIAVIAVLAALQLPDRSSRLTLPGMALPLPLELPALLLLLVAAAWLPRALRTMVTAAAGLVLTLVVTAKLADIGSRTAFGRPFEVVLDLPLLGAGWNLLSGSVGRAGAAAAFAAAGVALVLLGALFVWAVGRLGAAAARWPVRTALLAGLGLALGGAAQVATPQGQPPRADFAATRFAATHVTASLRSLDDITEFDAAAAIDPVMGLPDEALLNAPALAGKDVLVVFVESYGSSALEDPRYAPAVTAALGRAAERLESAGLGVTSGYLVSPTVGGQSWLAHGALLAGLRVDNQRRYDRLIGSSRGTLNRDFRRAGWRTVAVMPAITMDWPESAFFGYDAIYDSEGLAYRGKPFNWVTMPDQYTLAAFDRFERPPGPRRPVMAEIALISSHAPWTPIPTLVDWDDVGDGSVFNDMASSGDPPDVVWRDSERVRLQYRLSIEYAVETVAAYLADKGGPDLVAFVVGDHQPAPLITGDDAGRRVPMHVIAADPAVHAALSRWNWQAGLLPDPAAEPLPMEDFRARLVRTFSDAP